MSRIYCSCVSADAGARSRCAWRSARRARASCACSLFESLLVSVIAGAVGAFAAWTWSRSFRNWRSKFLPLETGTATSLSIPVLTFTIGLSLLTGLLDGNLSGVAKLARRSGRWVERRRTRNERQSCANIVSAKSWSARKSRFRSCCWPAPRCSSPVSSGLSQQEHRLPLPESLDGLRLHCRPAQYPDPAVAATFCRTNLH